MATKPVQASRQEVLAWMEEHGRGYRAAAKHFDLKVNTVKAWKRRAKQAAEAMGCTPLAPGGVHPTKTATPAASERGAPPSPDAGVRPKEPAVPRFVPSGSRAVLSASSMDVEARTMLRRSVNRLLAYLSGDLDEPMVTLEELVLASDFDEGERIDIIKALRLLHWSPRGAKEASVALGILIDKCPDILAFEDKINGDSMGAAGGPRSGSASDRVRAALDGSGSAAEG